MAHIPGFFSTLFAIAFPIILQNFLQTFVNMLDTVMVGRLGSIEIAAVGLGNQIFFLLNMILFGISSGGSIFVAQFWGKKDITGIRRTLGITLALSFFVSIIFALASFFFPRELISLYSKDENVIALGANYLHTVSLSYPLLAISFAFQIAFRATEHVHLPIASTAISFGVNAFFNYALIFGANIFGFQFPNLGVIGAAIATIISRAVELLITIVVSYALHFEPCGKLQDFFSIPVSFFGKFIRIVLPVILNESLWGFGITMQNAIFSHAGTSAIAAFNITATTQQLTWVFFIGVGNAAGVIIGKKIGEGNESEARSYVNKFAYFMPLCAVGFAFLLLPISASLPLLFKVDSSIILQAKKMLFVLMFLYPANAFNMFFIIGMCRAGGDTVYAAFNDIAWMWFVALPLAALAAFFWHAPPFVIYACLQIEQLFKLAMGLLRVRNGKWLHNVTH